MPYKIPQDLGTAMPDNPRHQASIRRQERLGLPDRGRMSKDFVDASERDSDFASELPRFKPRVGTFSTPMSLPDI